MREDKRMGGPILVDQWCYSCDNKTVHKVMFVSDINFVGNLVICTMCGETINDPAIGATGIIG